MSGTCEQVPGVVGQRVQGSVQGLGPVGSRDLGHVKEALGGILPGQALVVLPRMGAGSWAMAFSSCRLNSSGVLSVAQPGVRSYVPCPLLWGRWAFGHHEYTI